MKSLALCPSCARHVKPDETVCPLMAAGAALLCAACQRSSVALYGGAIFDSGAQTVDAGTQTDAGVDSSDAAK